MSSAYDRSQIFRRAHEIARWRVATVGESVKPYSVWFAEALRSEYRKIKQAKLRDEQNLNGLPIASCRLDALAYRRPVPSVSHGVYLGSREGAIAALEMRVSGSFMAAHAAGRRAVHFI